jgi:uncharacterized protein
LKYSVLPGKFAVCQVADGAEIPRWAWSGEFCSVTRTAGEVSIVCAENLVATDHEGIVVEGGWVALGLEGPFPFAMTGVLESFIQPLAQAGIPIFAISTFNTDYVLIKNENVKAALTALATAGHEMIAEIA